MDNDRELISVVVPVYNEARVIDEFHARLAVALEAVDCDTEIIYVDDGSDDATVASILDMRARDNSVALIELSRNFGKEVALSAGLDHANGDAVVVIDADLQDDPGEIPKFLEKLEEGFDVVSG